MARKPHYSGPWKQIRRRILDRDEHRCQIRAHGCLQWATEVDHILPVALGGAWWDDENLRAACRPCNLGRNIKARTTSSRRW